VRKEVWKRQPSILCTQRQRTAGCHLTERGKDRKKKRQRKGCRGVLGLKTVTKLPSYYTWGRGSHVELSDLNGGKNPGREAKDSGGKKKKTNVS